MDKDNQRRKCFIITPVGNKNSDVFRKAKGAIESVIKPVLEKYGFDDVKPSYEILESGMISNQIINRIINDDLVIANLTGNNPNVMYELAIRHATAKPIIHICENGTMLPFDIKDNRTIFYTDDMLGVQELNKEFESFVSKINYSDEYRDNPIYSAMHMEMLIHKMDGEGRKTEAHLFQIILEKISSLNLKTEHENILENRTINEYEGYFSIFIDLHGAKKEELSLFKKILEKDMIVIEQENAKEEINFNLYNNEFCHQYQMLDSIEQAAKISKIGDYSINSIIKLV